MTAIYRGAEDIHLVPIAGATISTAAGVFRSGYARCAFQGSASAFWRLPAAWGYFGTNFWFSMQSIWASTGRGTGNSSNFTFRFNTAGDKPQLVLAIDTIYGAYPVLYIANASGSLVQAAVATTPVSLTNMQKYDMQVNYSTSGSFNLYASGFLVLSYTGDVTGGTGTTQIAGFDLGGDNPSYFSELIWDTADTRAMSLVTLAPNGAGSLDQWPSGSYANVDEVVDTGATSDSTNTAGQTELYTQSGLPTGNWSILDYTWSAQALTTSGSPQHLVPTIETGGTQYTTPEVLATTAAETFFSRWAVNPNTSSPFTASDINSLQSGYGSAA